MVFESVRGYVQLASGLSELTRARATEVARGLLSLQGTGIETGSKLAVQVNALAEELLAAATTNRHSITALVRSEVDAAVSRLGLVSTEKLQGSEAEAARLRTEVAELRTAASRVAGAKDPAVKRAAVKKAAGKKAPAVKKAAVKKAPVVKEIPAVKETAAVKETPAVQKIAAVKETPALEETAATSAAAKPVTMAATTRPSAIPTRRKPAGT